MVTLSLTHHRKADFERFEAFVSGRDEITECISTEGGMDYVLKDVSPDLAAFQELIQAMIDAEPAVDRFMTCIVTRTVKATHPNLARLSV